MVRRTQRRYIGAVAPTPRVGPWILHLPSLAIFQGSDSIFQLSYALCGGHQESSVLMSTSTCECFGKVDMIVALRVSENYRNCRTEPPIDSSIWKGLHMLFDGLWQALGLKPTCTPSKNLHVSVDVVFLLLQGMVTELLCALGDAK